MMRLRTNPFKVRPRAWGIRQFGVLLLMGVLVAALPLGEAVACVMHVGKTMVMEGCDEHPMMQDNYDVNGGMRVAECFDFSAAPGDMGVHLALGGKAQVDLLVLAALPVERAIVPLIQARAAWPPGKQHWHFAEILLVNGRMRI